ncbi:hypothetical protein Btru_076283 [Bulinus truncatus]|nr:hypothetical protein Btru_076283 [Bulinus truncatus]
MCVRRVTFTTVIVVSDVKSEGVVGFTELKKRKSTKIICKAFTCPRGVSDKRKSKLTKLCQVSKLKKPNRGMHCFQAIFNSCVELSQLAHTHVRTTLFILDQSCSTAALVILTRTDSEIKHLLLWHERQIEWLNSNLADKKLGPKLYNSDCLPVVSLETSEMRNMAAFS